MSNSQDVAGTVECEGKGGTPKGYVFCGCFLGRKFNRLVTVIS